MDGELTGCALPTASAGVCILIRENGLNELSVRTYTPCGTFSRRSSGEGREAFLDETYPMVRFQVVNLLPEDQRPQVLAEKLDDIQRIHEPRAVPRESASTSSAGLMRFSRTAAAAFDSRFESQFES